MVLGDQTPCLSQGSQEPAPPLLEGSVCPSSGGTGPSLPLPCGAASHTLVALPGQHPSLDTGNSDLFKLGSAQLKKMLGTPSRLPSFTCQGSCAFARHSPERSLWQWAVQKAGEELRQCWGRMEQDGMLGCSPVCPPSLGKGNLWWGEGTAFPQACSRDVDERRVGSLF